MGNHFVVDNSVVMSWCFADEENDYDASYLDLAMRKDVSLATRDTALMKAAKHCQVPIFE